MNRREFVNRFWGLAAGVSLLPWQEKIVEAFESRAVLAKPTLSETTHPPAFVELAKWAVEQCLRFPGTKIAVCSPTFEESIRFLDMCVEVVSEVRCPSFEGYSMSGTRTLGGPLGYHHPSSVYRVSFCSSQILCEPVPGDAICGRRADIMIVLKPGVMSINKIAMETLSMCIFGLVSTGGHWSTVGGYADDFWVTTSRAPDTIAPLKEFL